MQPETKFARSAWGAIGYQVFGSGSVDLVFCTNWQNNIDLIWDEPSAVRYLDRLSSFARVIMFNQTGSGVSDAVSVANPPNIDSWIEDLTAVMDEVGCEKAALLGDTEGGYIAMAFAATHPDRVLSLALVNGCARFTRADHYPTGIPPELFEQAAEAYAAQHGTTGDGLAITAPSVADDPRFRRWWNKYQRNSMKPAMLQSGFAWQSRTDLTSILSTITAPTIVLHRKDAMWHRIAHGRYLAEHIADAEFVELSGADTLPFFPGDYEEVLGHVERFVTGKSLGTPADRRLATVLFTDIVDSTRMASDLGDERWLDLLAETNRISRAQVARFGGTFVHTTGDGHLAYFDGPARAVTAAQEIIGEGDAIGVKMRAGLHTGEISVTGDDIAGIAVHIASRVIDHASDGRIAVSSTVKDLTFGSSHTFEPLGAFDLKGVPGSWSLFEVA
ncbi:MAG: alpha/beta fold hydrolase [Armatimonadetes bacterium]|nr:MAG: alpha/beta fold hydrolase [Armatimonadota bacterium]